MAQWFQTYRTPIHPWMCDQFGHLNVRFYAHLFDDASFSMWPLMGVGMDAIKALGLHTVVARTETDFVSEVLPGRIVTVRSRLAGVGSKSVRYEQELHDAETSVLHARQRSVEVFFDPQTRSSAPIPPSIRAVLDAVLAAGTPRSSDSAP